ncbi:unnamed protein product [Umbelopsis sp. WA50703]
MRPLLYVFSSLVLSGLTVAKPVQSFWYETITHNGISPFIPNGDSWTVFRNVKDYGAKGDGVTDDSAAIQSAINAGGKGSGGNGFGTTGAPAVVYFPSGTYAMGSAIQSFVDTVIMGNPISRPTLKALSNFSNSTIIYGKDPGFDATINFYQGIKNLIIDSTAVSHNTTITLLDWSVSQATQLTNVLFNMPHNSLHTGVSTPEGGSGTYLGDLEFVGGKYGINLNNQQYSFKNIKFTGCNTGVYITHGFALVMQEMDFVDCETAVDSTSGGVGNVGSIALIDSTATSVGTVINTKSESGADDSIIIDNLSSTRSGATVKAGGTTILSGSVANRWVYGNAYTAVNASKHDAGTTYRYARPSALLSGKKYFTMAPPTYQDETHVVNIKSVSGLPVHGDGVRDDTANINTILAKNAGKAVVFFPAGTYLVSNTIHIPVGTRIIGEVWSAISATGNIFKSASAPVPMVQVGKPGDVGMAQISDMLFTVADVLPGCILLEVNMAGSSPGDVGFWNSHFRIGGAAGSKVETSCTDPTNPCKAAFMLLHLTSTSSAYIEDMWGWTADHDLDANNAMHISTGRGAYVQATKATWLVGTAFEHNTLYQYSFSEAKNIFVGMQQCETPYWQGIGSSQLAPAPWTANSKYDDPTFSNCAATDANCRMAWFLNIVGGSNMEIYGSSFWTFFNYDGNCEGTGGSCQDNAVNIVGKPTTTRFWNLNTRSQINMVIDGGAVGATQNANSGSWGGVIAAYLPHA